MNRFLSGCKFPEKRELKPEKERELPALSLIFPCFSIKVSSR